jgi:hypothetical protein
MSGLADKVRSVLGIKSPSKVFAAIGEQMGEGLDVGFLGTMKRVARDMANAIPTDFNTNVNLNARGGASGGMSGGYGTSTVINQNLTITTPKALSERELAREFRSMSQRLALEIG